MTPASARPGRGYYFHVFLIAILLVASGAPGPAVVSAGEPVEAMGELNVGIWEGAAWSHRAAGLCCWVSGNDGSIRLEVLENGNQLTGPGSEWRWPEALLNQTGIGWTVVLNPDGTGTMNPWGEAWREIPGDLGPTIQALLGAWRDGIRTDRRVVVQPSRGEHSFRKEMVSRGRGIGGPGEVLVFRSGKSGGLAVHSSRRPGRLTLGASGSTPITYVFPETFVPLWPLVELIARSH